VGGACSTYEDGRYIQNFGWKTGREENPEDIGEDENIILEWILEK
jgi:hypothetical protein